MNSAAITDHGNMYGVVEFYKTAKANDINPIIGCEVYVAPNSRFDRELSHEMCIRDRETTAMMRERL